MEGTLCSGALFAVQTETAVPWVTLAEAGALLGCSVDTVRRRVKQGAVHAEQRTSPRGAVWYIRADTLPSVQGRAANGAAHDAPHVAEHAQHGNGPLLEALRQLAVQRDQLLHLAGQVGYLQRQVQEHQETIKALQAPTPHQSAQDGQQGGSVAGMVSDDLVRPSVTPRKAWWRFW